MIMHGLDMLTKTLPKEKLGAYNEIADMDEPLSTWEWDGDLLSGVPPLWR